MRIFWVGNPKGKNLTSKLYYNDITDRYNKSIEALGDEKELVNYLKEVVYKDYNSFIVKAESAEEAVNVVVEQFSEKCKLKVVK